MQFAKCKLSIADSAFCNLQCSFCNLHFLFVSVFSVPPWLDFYVLRFFAAEAEAVAAEFEFEGVAERGRAESTDFDTRRDSHLHQPAADVVASGDSHDAC